MPRCSEPHAACDATVSYNTPTFSTLSTVIFAVTVLWPMKTFEVEMSYYQPPLSLLREVLKSQNSLREE